MSAVFFGRMKRNLQNRGERMLSRQDTDNRNTFEIVSLEEMVPADHLLRKVDAVLDLDFVYDIVTEKYTLDNGRPSIDPVVLVKIVLIQKLFGIRSMRQTIREIETNMAYRWYLGLGFADRVPHFSTFGKNYTRRFSDNTLFEAIFARIIDLAMAHGLIDTSHLYIDSTHIKANANRNRYTHADHVQTARAYQADLDAEINRQRVQDGKKPMPPNDSPLPVRRRKVSTTDPDAGYYVKGERERQFAYSWHACCDANGFIIDHHVTPGNIHDSTQLPVMVDRLEARGILPLTLAVDAGYKTPHNAHFLLSKTIVPCMPYTRPHGVQGMFTTRDFLYDAHYDQYICPNDAVLTYRRTDREGKKLYMSDPAQCRDCPLLAQCTTSRTHVRQIQRHVWQDDLDIVEDLRHVDTIKQQYRMRSQTIERRFGDAKEQHGMRWTKYRGIGKVTMDAMLVGVALNLKKLATWVGSAPIHA